MYRNSEGYADPTVGAALSHMGKVEAREKREYRRKKAMVVARPKVYVVSPFAGDIENNVRQARRYCRFAASKNTVPVTNKMLRAKYKEWCADNGEHELSQRPFSQKLLERGFEKKKSSSSGGQEWHGFGLAGEASRL